MLLRSLAQNKPLTTLQEKESGPGVSLHPDEDKICASEQQPGLQRAETPELAVQQRLTESKTPSLSLQFESFHCSGESSPESG